MPLEIRSFPTSRLGTRSWKLQLPENTASQSLQGWVPKQELGNQQKSEQFGNQQENFEINPMNWQEVCDDPLLRNLPYKIELNEWGNIVMSPATSQHGILQGLIQDALRAVRRDGLVFPECPIQTAKGVKVPDVVWASDAFLGVHAGSSPFLHAPELCIEVMSPANSLREMEEKRELYFARGAQEVWLCDEHGALTFYDCTGQIPASRLFPGIHRIESDYLH